MILGHEAIGVVDEIGDEVKDFKPGDKVIVPAITPDWGSKEHSTRISLHKAVVFLEVGNIPTLKMVYSANISMLTKQITI